MRTTARRARKGTQVPRWQVAENVVAAYERIRARLPEVKVTQKVRVPRRDGRRGREVDVMVEVPVGDRVLKIGVDVKNWARPLTVEQMGTLLDKRRKIAIDRYCVVSTSGFSAEALRDAELDGVETVSMEELERSEFFSPGEIVFETWAEVLDARLLFAPEVDQSELVAWLGAGGLTVDLHLEGPGPAAPLSKALPHHARLIGGEMDLRDGEQFSFGISIDPTQHDTLRFGDHTLHAPTTIQMSCRYRKRPLADFRFRIAGMELLVVEMVQNGERKHLIVAAQAVPGMDASTLAISVSPASPIPSGPPR